MIKRFLKNILLTLVISVGIYIGFNKYTNTKSILIGRPVDVRFIIPGSKSLNYEYIENDESDKSIDRIDESSYMSESEYIHSKNKIVAEDEKEIKEIEFELTFYTSLDSENGYSSITSTGENLSNKILLASNVYNIGTKIYLDGFGILEVKDKGGFEMNMSNRLDVYIPREKGESDDKYRNRVLGYGRKKIKGYIIN